MADMMSVQQLQSLGYAELNEQLATIGKQVAEMRYQLALNKSDVLKDYRLAKKQIARIKTVIRAQQLNQG